MIVLALDPGPVTGWALMDAGGVAGCGGLRPEDLDVSIDYLVRLAHRAGHPVEVALNRYDGGSVQDEYVRRTIRRWLVGVFDIQPVEVREADWRRSRAARVFEYPAEWDGSPLAEPQRRAIAIGAYYLKPGPQLRKRKAGNWSSYRRPA